MGESDVFLVERLRNKEEDAFTIVFNSYYSILCGYANKYLNDFDTSEEIVQEVFVKFWERCEQLAPDSSVKSYLFRAVHNSCLNHLKHSKVKDAYREYVIRQLSQEASYSHSWNEEPYLEGKIEQAISSLPPQCQRIFRMSRFDGLKYQEIADELGLSVKTIEVQICKALRILREKLQEFLPEVR